MRRRPETSQLLVLMHDAGPLEDRAYEVKRILRLPSSSEAFLDEGNHPRIVATAVDITGVPPLLNVGLNIRIKQTEMVIRVPTRITVDAETFRAVGELYLLQSDFGIEPFSSFLGFISVKDPVQIRFDILGRILE